MSTVTIYRIQIYRGNNYSIFILRIILCKNSLHKQILLFSNVHIRIFVFGGLCLHYTITCLLKARTVEPEKLQLLCKGYVMYNIGVPVRSGVPSVVHAEAI